MSDTTTTALDPGHIMQIGLGFWASKTLLSAVELQLFSTLGSGSMTAEEIKAKLALHERGYVDFLDALVSLHLLTREGDGPKAHYANTPETARFLDTSSPAYVGGMLEMANAAPLSVLGQPHRGTTHRGGTERVEVGRRLLWGPVWQRGPTGAVHVGDARPPGRQRRGTP